MIGILADLKHGFRLHLGTPLSSATALFMLSLALAFLTAFLSLWNDLVLREHPGFDRADRLVTLTLQTPESLLPMRLALLEEIAENTVSLDALSGIKSQPIHWQHDRRLQILNAELVTRAYFERLKPKLQLGRGLSQSDHSEDGAVVAVISYDLWRQEFNGHMDVLGQTIDLRGVANTLFSDSETEESDSGSDLGPTRIVGVMHESMRGTFGSSTQLWLAAERSVPILYNYLDGIDPAMLANYRISARLSPDTNLKVAELELETRYANGFSSAPWLPNQSSIKLHTGVVGNPEAHADLVEQVQILLIASLLVALVAGININLFLLSRMPRRVKELGIRMTVGATSRRLARQLVTESALLIAISALAGLVLSFWLVVYLQTLPSLSTGVWRETTPLDWRVLFIVLAVGTLILALVSMAPLISLKQAGISAAAKSIPSRANGFQRGSGSLQIAVAIITTTVTLAFAWHLRSIETVNIGFDETDVIVIQPEMPSAFAMLVDSEETKSIRQHRRDTLMTLPGIQQVAFGIPVPNGRTLISLSERMHPTDGEPFIARLISADPVYLELLENRIIRGRLPKINDPPGLIINRALAEAYFGHINVIDQTLPVIATLGADHQLPIVAVMQNMVFDHPTEMAGPMVFWPNLNLAPLDRILIKSPRALSDVRSDIETLIERGTLEFEIHSMYRLEQRRREISAPERTRFYFSVMAGGVVLLLALFGYYGIQRYLIVVGRREYAIRSAVGAGPKAIRRIIFLHGLRIAAPGIFFGAVCAYITLVWIRDSIIDHQTPILIITVLVTASLLLMTVLASAGPAFEAAHHRPAESLRDD